MSIDKSKMPNSCPKYALAIGATFGYEERDIDAMWKIKSISLIVLVLIRDLRYKTKHLGPRQNV